MVNNRLDATNISDLMKFDNRVTKEFAEMVCVGVDPHNACTQVYGVYNNGLLVSIMTATFCYVFPHSDSPSGRIVQISGAFTNLNYRRQGYALKLLEAIEADAVQYFKADYLCCDATCKSLYKKAGFNYAPNDEIRMWKRL